MIEKPRCFHCKTELELAPGNLPRAESCPKCSSDVKVCYNCKFFDLNSYNECREPSAERVVDKEKRNFCEYFLLEGRVPKIGDKTKKNVLKKLDDLFK